MLDFVLQNKSNKIVFNAELFEIKQNNEIVEVKVRDTSNAEMSTFRAKKVISAIPINLIGKVNFEPALPLHKTNVLRSCRIGNYGKLIITYKEAFWRNKGFSGEVVSDGSTVILKNESDKEFPTRGPISAMFDASNYDDKPALIVFLAADGLVQWFGKFNIHMHFQS